MSEKSVTVHNQNLTAFNIFVDQHKKPHATIAKCRMGIGPQAHTARILSIRFRKNRSLYSGNLNQKTYIKNFFNAIISEKMVK